MARPSFFLRCGFELKKLQFVETKCQQHLVGTGNPEFVSSVLGIRIQSNHTDAVAQTGLSNLHHFTSPEVLRLRVWCGKAQIQLHIQIPFWYSWAINHHLHHSDLIIKPPPLNPSCHPLTSQSGGRNLWPVWCEVGSKYEEVPPNSTYILPIFLQGNMCRW